jgi:hypothetical protein
MKRKYFFMLLISAGLFYGCSLEEEPRTFISPNVFFTNEASYDAAVVGIYSDIGNIWGGNQLMMTEMFSDIYDTPDESNEQALPTYQNNTQPFFYNVRDLWSTGYAIVKNANFVISKTPDDYPGLIAEARFLRAYAYFHLVQFYGKLPLRKTPVEDYAEVQLSRSSEQEIYDFILEDLLYAESSLPDYAPLEGRVSKLAATALLAKVYLTLAGNPLNKTEYFAAARDRALTVINSGRYTLPETYADVFHTTNYSPEVIWGKVYDPQKGNNSITYFVMTSAGYKPILLPAPWFINSFSAGDQRKKWGINEGYTDPGGNVLKTFFQKFVNNANIDADLSVSAMITSYPIPILRLAEMYLIAAEAENEINGPAQAYSYINKIRWRARTDKNDPASVPDLKELTKEQFREAVYLERKHELHLEGSTWMDLKRTNNLQRIQDVRGNGLTHPIGIYNQTWPIPDTEITNNNIEQNPLP